MKNPVTATMPKSDSLIAALHTYSDQPTALHSQRLCCLDGGVTVSSGLEIETLV